jgi:hypothetical protein
VLGLILTFALGEVAGIVMGNNGGHWVAAPHTDAGGFPMLGWARGSGDRRVAHFFGVHAMHILPLAGWFIAARQPKATAIVWIVAGVLSPVTIYALVEALSGRPFLAFIG